MNTIQMSVFLVENISAAVSHTPTCSHNERERLVDLAAYFLDWHLSRAAEFAINDFQNKFRK
jgi:hypothetical protein